ncbi:MAG: hypothetical protein AUG48_07510 [Actinobacteria bacterium 13_1_20CM_3_68_9]|nr:MAG: hypothetical protein AUG48_07510 [Actinobacteria bacterium 13_1_20CM_3_68_9]
MSPLRRRGLASELRGKTVVTVLGMHRSGTSAVAGTVQEHGVDLGLVSERARFNARGNREIRELNQLHNAILERSGGSWWDPPRQLRLQRRDFRRRDEILGAISGETIGVKDPRMLVTLDLWRDLQPKPIGVIRNPVAVRKSLERELWVTYNRALLEELEREPFPVIDFDRHGNLDAQVRAALAFHDLEAATESRFFDRGLVGQRVDEWRGQVVSTEALGLWDELSQRSLA